MPLRIRCPEGCSFNAPVMQAGRQVRCPVCREVIQIPEFDAAAAQQVLVARRAEGPAESSESSKEPDSDAILRTPDSSHSEPLESTFDREAKIVSVAQDMLDPSPRVEPHESEPTVRPSDAEPSAAPFVEAQEPKEAPTDTDSLPLPIHEAFESADPSLPFSQSPEPLLLGQEESGHVHHADDSSGDHVISDPGSESPSMELPSTPEIRSLAALAPADSTQIADAASPQIELTDEAPSDPPSVSEVSSDLPPALEEPVPNEAIPSLSSLDLGTSDPSVLDPERDSQPDRFLTSDLETPPPQCAEPHPEPELEEMPSLHPASSPPGESSPTLASEPTETTPHEAAHPSSARASDTPDPASTDTIVGVIPSSDTPSAAENLSPSASFPAIVTAAATAVPTIQLDHSRLAVFEVRRHQAAFETTRRTVSRIIAFLILCLGLANVAIGLFQSGWLVNPASSELRTWAIVLILIGGLHGAYAALLAQVSDWSAHWVSATFLLLMALGSAATAVVLGLARPDHGLIRWLELPTLLQVQGAIWALCMVLMSSALAWWCGREAISWRTVVSQLRQREAANQDAQAT